MALTPATPREKLDRLLQYAARARRYWWLVVGLVVMGGALSVAFAMTRPRMYQSGSVLYYQERIQTSLLQNRDVSTMHRNIGERYRELLLARNSLVEVIRDPKLNPYPELLREEGEEAAVEELRESIDFAPRGANTFVIRYTDAVPARARDVTARLTELLKAKDGQIRLEQAEATFKLAEKLKNDAIEELRGVQNALNQFLATHPEFAMDEGAGQGEGAGIRAQQEASSRTRPRTAAEAALQALERQRTRIKARIANPDAPPPAPEPRAPRARTAAQLAADQKVGEAERELEAAERTLAETLGKVTDRHPDAIRARDNVAGARTRLASARAAVPPDARDVDDPILPAGPVDRAQLAKALTDVERLIAAERARQKGIAPPDASADKPSNWVVQLEDEYQRLRLEVEEHRQRVKTLGDSAFRSKLDAQQRAAETGGSLTVVDEAYKPLKPIGKGKKVVVLGGLFLFTLLGGGLALGLALIDDRVYRRQDLENLAVAPTLAVIPRPRARARRGKRTTA